MFELILFISIAFLVCIASVAIVYINKTVKKNPQRMTPAQASAANQVPIYFILLNLLYAIPLSVRCLFTREIEGDISGQLEDFIGYLPISLVLVSFFILFFAVSYSRFIKSEFRRKKSTVSHNIKGKSFFVIYMVILILSLMMLVALAKEVGGLFNLILTGYSVTELFIGQNHLAIGIDWILSLLVILFSYSLVHDNNKIRLISISLIIVTILSLVIMGRRGMIVGLMASLLAVYHFGYRNIRFKTLVMVLLLGFISMNAVGLMRGSSYENLSDLAQTASKKHNKLSADQDYDLFYTLTTGNFVVPFETLPQIISRLGYDIKPRCGVTLVQSLSYLIPNKIWEERPLPLANWYMQEFYGGSAMNEGRQFFFLSESYLNFGPLGIILFGLLYAYLFARFITGSLRNSNNPFYLALFGLIVGNLLIFVASDISGILAFMKGMGLPVLLFLTAEWCWSGLSKLKGSPREC